MTQTQVASGPYVNAAKDVADILEEARLPEPLRQSIWGSLAYFLERDGDPIEPDSKSLRLLLSFISDHKDRRPPDGLGVTKEGVIEAMWETPKVFRWTLEFLPAGKVRWTYIEQKKEGIVHDTGIDLPDAVPIPERISA